MLDAFSRGGEASTAVEDLGFYSRVGCRFLRHVGFRFYNQKVGSWEIVSMVWFGLSNMFGCNSRLSY